MAVKIGTLIDQMSTLREKRRELTRAEEELGKKFHALEEQLIALMDKEGQPKASGKLASATIKEDIVFNTVDWTLFMNYLIKSKQGHLVQRRISAPAVLELYKSKGVVPGLQPFPTRKISLRNANGGSEE